MEPEIGGRGATTIPGDTSPTVGELFDRVSGSSRGIRSVSVEVGETQAAVELTISVPYGRSIPEVVKSMRDNVIQRVENLTDLDVPEVNITVKDVFFPSSMDKKDAHGSYRGRLALTGCQRPAARLSAASDSRGCA